MSLQVILNENVQNLGQVGDIVDVANGYARNYLLPKQLAVLATNRNVKQLEHTKRLVDLKRGKALAEAKGLADTLAEHSVTITRQVGDEDKLFGSVNRRDIADALETDGFVVDKRNILLDKPIKTLGVFPVDIKLHGEINAQIKVWIVAE
jgi:large subunit ribosomal protein L9